MNKSLVSLNSVDLAIDFRSKLDTFFDSIITFKSIVVGIEIGLFELLKKDFLPIEDIAKELGVKCPIRNFLDFLDKLYVNKFLLREGTFLQSKYKNANGLFVLANPANLIHLVKNVVNNNENYIPKLKKFIMGEETNPVNLFTDMYYEDEHKAEMFTRAMTSMQSENFDALANQFDFEPYKSVVDVGGCLGTCCIALKSYHPHLKCINYDLEKIHKNFDKYIMEFEMATQIEFYGGDFMKDELFPKTDVIVLGNILHDWNKEIKDSLLKKSYNSLNPNGILFIIEDIVDDNRKKNTFGLDTSLLMLVKTYGGFNASFTEYEEYAKAAGFKSCKNLQNMIGIPGLICYKDKE